MGKVQLIALILAVCVCASSGEMRSCFRDENCEPGECCISMVFVRGFCNTLGAEGDHCIMQPADTAHGKKNIFGCPCKEGLKCIPGSIVKEDDGKVTMKDMACKKEWRWFL